MNMQKSGFVVITKLGLGFSILLGKDLPQNTAKERAN